MSFEWDENKNLKNQEMHGLSFEAAQEAFAGNIVVKVDNRFDYGEVRKVLLGEVRGRVVFIVFTEREGNIRIISARKANRKEVRAYYEEID
ncbi:BrnT family toxin [Gloeocapsa sp. PCC 73106]|uniref:BrnT family toxin n=1 Tax=Gloeocapsa sp. PCC 73106 TaxID=102232 RepID=UPI00054D2F89|nr:BrnT family toxin [Gloeocapsa sp. PCC 73106]